MSSKKEIYFVPHQSHWPLVGAVALFLVALGSGLTVQNMGTDAAGGVFGKFTLVIGFAVLLYMLAGWFSNVITESLSCLLYTSDAADE